MDKILWAARLFDMYQQPQSKFDYVEHPTQKSDTSYLKEIWSIKQIHSTCQAEIEAELTPSKDLELLVHPWILRSTKV